MVGLAAMMYRANPARRPTMSMAYTEYSGTGADGVWISADDTVSFAQVNDPNK